MLSGLRIILNQWALIEEYQGLSVQYCRQQHYRGEGTRERRRLARKSETDRCTAAELVDGNADRAARA
ncbi:hypothetical protein R1flu_018002 [Riccia fluitans]|uniref:Uncharacterized protein n=1 Tax=Riccia fluitans TaxID=41844 RepID=A0ABD1ZEK5_9MARC